MTTKPLTPVPPPSAPRRRPRWRRPLIIAGLVLGAFAALGAISEAVSPAPASAPAAARTSAPAPLRATHAAPPSPAPTVTVTAAPKPAVTVSAAPRPAVTVTARPKAAPRDAILARFGGTGLGTTGTFTVPLSGVWHLSWAYRNGTLFAGQAENFQVWEYDADSGALVDVLVNALAPGTGQPTAVPVYDQAEAGGRVYFKVITEDARWWLVPVAGSA